jgi:ribosomal protein S3
LVRNNTKFAGMLKEDIEVREFLKKKLKNASVGRVVIERPAKNAYHHLQLASGRGDRQEG